MNTNYKQTNMFPNLDNTNPYTPYTPNQPYTPYQTLYNPHTYSPGQPDHIDSNKDFEILQLKNELEYYRNRSDEDILDTIPTKKIEKYLRNKKLNKLNESRR
jgi:hypothetical protein